MSRELKKTPGRRVPTQIEDPRSRPNALDYRDGVCYLEDLEIGDAGAGYRRNQVLVIFSQLFEPDDGVPMRPLNEAYTVLEAPPLGQQVDNCRMKFWSVRFYGCQVINMGENGLEKFSPIRGGNPCKSLDIDQIPMTIQGWIRTDDGMFRSFDVIGDRTVEVYGSQITAGFLAPEGSVLVYGLAPDGSDDPQFQGIVSQSWAGVTITPIINNSSQQNDEFTRCIQANPSTTGADGTYVIIPPGSRHVQVSIPNPPAVVADLVAAFTWIPQNGLAWPFEGSSSVVDFSAELVGSGQSKRLALPNAPFIRVENKGDSVVSLCFTFTKEL